MNPGTAAVLAHIIECLRWLLANNRGAAEKALVPL